MDVARRLIRTLTTATAMATALGMAAVSPALAASAPMAATGGPKSVTSTSATLTGTVNPEGQDTTYYFQYGTSTAYGSQTASASAGAVKKKVPVSASVASLSANTTYHYRLVATNATGTTFGADKVFKTTNPPPAPPAAGAPIVATGGAKSITPSAATLTGNVNPNGAATTYQFQYGTTTSYGGQTASTSAGSGNKNVPASASVASLSPNTTYHYRLVATNASGTSTGADKTFKTPNAGSLTLLASAGSITFGQTTTLSGTVHAPGPLHTTVTLQSAPSAAGPFTTVATTMSNNKGAYTFAPQAPASNTVYRTLANGATSVPVRVIVHFGIALLVSTTHPRRGHTVRFHGTVGPRHNGARVLIQRLGADGRWHTVARPRLHAGIGNESVYSIRIRISRNGRYRAVVSADRHNARGVTRAVRIRVR